MKSSAFPLVVLLALAAVPSWAFNTMFLEQAPYTKFSEDDKRLLAQNIDKALAESADGQKTQWKNDASGASGSLTPQKSFERDGRKCRSIEVRNRYKALRDEGQIVVTYCQDDAGKWTLTK